MNLLRKHILVVAGYVHSRDVVLGMLLKSAGKVFVFVGRVAAIIWRVWADFAYYNMNLQQVKVNIQLLLVKIC